MQIVGRIDKDIYSCIAGEIITDEVVITDNQMRHILDRHPEAYEKVIACFEEAIKNPDYIIDDKHENTGLVIKQISDGNNYTQIVLRICTSGDETEYKNSIISSWEISEKRLKNYLRNKKVLYKNT